MGNFKPLLLRILTPIFTNSLSDAEKNIFYEVLRVTLAMFHRDYTYEETVITTDVNTLEFTTKGRVEVDKGWKIFFATEKKQQEEKTAVENVLPSVSTDEKVSALISILEGHTTPPKPFTEGALINLMKTAGKMVEDEADAYVLKEVETI